MPGFVSHTPLGQFQLKSAEDGRTPKPRGLSGASESAPASWSGGRCKSRFIGVLCRFAFLPRRLWFESCHSVGKRLSLLGGILVVGFFAVSCALKPKSTLVVGMELNYPPFE